MLYHLLAPLARQHIIFNLFNYITFRAAGATVTALLLAFIVGPWIIGKLREHRIGQVSFGIGLGVYLLMFPLTNSVAPNATQLPFFKYYVWILSWPVYLAFVTFVTTASSNAVNLTDGLDGLAAGLTVIVAGAFAIFCYLFGRVDAAKYLGVLYLPGAGELTIFCGALMGAALGFLWFNAHPAQVFMGDTGALAIGGALGTVAILLKTEFLLLIASAV